MALGALGVVFGDIGTSPLYALKECFDTTHHGVLLNPENVLGVLSLFIWTLLLIICVKYMVFILTADNKGEGGILALTAMLGFNKNSEILKKGVFYIPIGLFGSALLFGDGLITPAISVLSAVEGLTIATPVFENFVLPLTLLIITGLFIVQRFGTQKIGSVFGPIVLMWFLTIGFLGLLGIINDPQVLKAFNPMYAIQFFMNNGIKGFLMLSSVFLVVTGGEALYADLGHFGIKPIRSTWFTIVLPCLLLNYLGQGSLIINDPTAIQNPFYLLAPKNFVIPLVILATSATVIASQALISGVYSLTRQAIQLGYLPRISIVHTSSQEIGQIYIPFINWTLLIGVLWLVIEFKSSSNLASAYGVAITATMAITTFLMAMVARYLWKWSRIKVGLFLGIFLTVDVLFFASCSVKLAEGGWIPLGLGLIIYIAMITWNSGRKILRERLKAQSMSVDEFVKLIKEKPPTIVPGSAIFMSGEPWGIPLPLLHNLKHNKIIHKQVALLTIVTEDIPTIENRDRITIDKITPYLFRIIAHCGFMETPQISAILRACEEKGIQFPIEETTFFLGRETIIASKYPGMSIWREKLFAVMSRNAQRPMYYFGIPTNQVIEVGIQVEI